MLKNRYYQVQALLTNICNRILVLAEQNEDVVHHEARKKISSFPNLMQRVQHIKQMGKPKVLEKIKVVNQSLTISQDVNDIVGERGNENRKVNMAQVLLMLQELIPLLKKM